MKNSNDTIGNQTRDIPACSAVSQPTAPPRSPIESHLVKIFATLPCPLPQLSATGPRSEPNKPSLYPPIFLKSTIFPHLGLYLPSGLFPSILSTIAFHYHHHHHHHRQHHHSNLT